MTPDLDDLAQRQLRDYDAHSPGSIFSDPEFNLTIAEAYDLQFRVATLRERRGEAIAGYKVGCLSEPIQKQLGMDGPIIGHVFASELHESGASLDSSGFHTLAIEGEFAFRIAEDVPDADWLAAGPMRAIESAFAVIELHNRVCRADPALRAQELIANNALHAGAVLPESETSRAEAADLMTEAISVVRNGQLLGSSNGAALPGGPLASLVLLAKKLEVTGRRLKRGHIVLAGSPLPLYATNAGDRFEVNCARLAGVQLNLLPQP